MTLIGGLGIIAGMHLYTSDHAAASSRLRHLDDTNDRLKTLSIRDIDVQGYLYNVRLELQLGEYPDGSVSNGSASSHIRVDGPAKDHPALIVTGHLIPMRPLKWTSDSLYQPIPLKREIAKWLDEPEQVRMLQFCRAVQDSDTERKIARGRIRKANGVLQREPALDETIANRLASYFPEGVPAAIAASCKLS